MVMVGEPEARGTGNEPGMLLKMDAAATVGARMMVVPVSIAAWPAVPSAFVPPTFTASRAICQ